MSKEILLVVDALANIKGVSKDVIFEAIAEALEIATAKKIGQDVMIRIDIDKATGLYQTYRQYLVVEPNTEADAALHHPTRELLVEQAQSKKPDAKPGDVIEESIESIEFGRIAAQTAKQVILQKMRKAEQDKWLQEYAKRIGELITGVVKRVTRDFVVLDLGENAEALLKREDMLPQDAIRTNDQVRAYIFDVEADARGAKVLVSRTHPQMVVELFRIEVPEVSEEVIEIKAAARDPGIRAKIAVKTNDGRIDPVGACVGMRGARVQAVSGELGGERIDIVLWDDNPAQLVINAMAPAEVASIIVDEDAHAMDIAVREEQLALAIGRNGQNVRLARELTGWTINIMTDKEFVSKSQAEAESFQQLFVTQLGVDEELAAILAREGFTSLEEVAYVPLQEMLDIPEFDEEIVEQLRSRAKDVLLTQAIANEEQQAIEDVPDLALQQLPGMTAELLAALSAADITTRDDLAELSVDDLLEYGQLTPEQAADLIMAARAHWFAESSE